MAASPNTLQMAQRALQNIVDIDITGLQIGVIQLTILLAELHQHLMPRPFRRALFGEQAIVGGIKQIFIVEQGVMTGEDRRDIGVKFVFRQLGERIEIGQRLVDRPAQRALLLAGDVGGGGAPVGSAPADKASRRLQHAQVWRVPLSAAPPATRRSYRRPAPETPPAPHRRPDRGPAGAAYRGGAPVAERFDSDCPG